MDTEENKTQTNENVVEPTIEHHHNHEHKNEHHKDHHDNHNKKSDGNNTMIMGILAYLGPLVVIPYLMEKNNSFVKFHIKQGLVLLSINVIFWVVSSMLFWHMWGIMRLLNLGITILVIIGIVNVIQKKESMLPIVGSFSKYFKF